MMKTLIVNRNLIVSIFAVLMLTCSIQGIGYGQELPDTTVEFKDIALAGEVRRRLGLPTGDGVDLLKIPKSELEKLTVFRSAYYKSIDDLTGLEHATQLRVLDIDDNNIRDITPLAQLTQLTVLNLADNNIINLTPLAELTQLTELYLYGNQIRDATPLAELTQLTLLNLGGNQIKDVTPLAELTQLTSLRLYGNQISDITPLAELTQLTLLNLGGNQIKDVTPLAELTQLTLLSLGDNNISDITPLTSLVNLQTLKLKGNPISNTSSLGLLLDESPGLEIDIPVTTGPVVEFADTTLARKVRQELRLPTGDGVEFLKIPKSELEKLTTLNNSFARDITDLTGLEHATQLRELDISLTGIGNVAPLDITPLAQLTQLISLTLWDNNIIDITPLAQLTQLTSLNLNENQIKDVTPLSQLIQLTSLNLNENQIRDITSLAQLTQLTKLNLSENQIRDITPLAQLTQLTSLNLSDNQIKDVTPLAPLTQLTELYLSENQIKDVTPLAQLTQLTKLSLRKNQIKDVTPLASLVNLQDLWLKDNPIWSTYPLNALLDANPGLGLDVKVTDAVPFPMTEVTVNALQNEYLKSIGLTFPMTPMTEVTVNGNAELRVLIPELQGQPMFWINTGTGKIESSGHFDAVTNGVTVLTVDRAGKKLYWGERGKSGGIIKRANFDGTNVEALVTLPNVPRGIVIDAVKNKMYWTNSDLQIQAATLNGENISTVIQLEEDILEETKRNCSSGGFFLLLVVPIILDGSCTTEIIRTNLTSPTDIALNTVDGRLYWTEFSGRIRRLNLDGTGLATLVPDIGSPYGIVVADDKVYWAEEIDENTGKIQRAKLNGTNIETLAEIQGLPTGISVDTAAGKVYWANSLGGIQRTDINGGEVEIVALGVTAPGDFVLVPDTQQTPPITEATTDATVSISPVSVASPAIGQQLEFSLNITGGEAVAGYQANVQFDTTALRYVSSVDGDYLPTGAFFVEPKVNGNLVQLNAASLAGESKGDGTLATLTFEVTAAKPSTLTLSDVLLSNTGGETFVPQIENAQITEPTRLKEDINADGSINIADLVLVASNLGKTGQNAADVNGDGQVNIADLVLVAGALGTSAAAPSLLHPDDLEVLTSSDVRQWLSQAQHLLLTDTTSQRGILFLEQLLTVLIPTETALLANYPNPFNPETWIPYHLSKDADVTLHIYAVSGTLVRTLMLGYQPAGMYQNRSRAAYWDGRNAFGEPVASGVYFYTLTAGDFTATRKMLIRK